MEARYAFRQSQWLDECQSAPEIFEQVIPRLYTFMKPFGKTFQGQAAEQHATTSVCGLLSDVERKNIASMASRFGQSRLPLQGFIGWEAWNDEPLRHALIGQVKTHLGQADGVLVCALCWRSPRTRRDAIWRRCHQSTVGRGAAPRAPGKALRPGGASMSAMVRKVHGWSRWSNGAWSPEAIGVSKATRHGWR